MAAQKAGRLVLILDGLDEMIARTDRKDIFFHLSFLLHSALFSTTPIVLTTRPNIIPSTSYYRRLGAAYTVITVDPLDDVEVKRYLHQLNAVHVLHALETGVTATMGDLLSRPLYVEMLIAAEDRIRAGAALDSLTLNRLYDFYLQYWYLRELQIVGRAPGDLPMETVRGILSLVAHKMSSTGKPYISETFLQSIIRDHALAQHIAIANDLFIAAKERLILVPDFTAEELRFSFRHDSLRSYFYAAHMADRITANALTDEDVMGLDPATIEFLFAIAESDPVLAANLASISSLEPHSAGPPQKMFWCSYGIASAMRSLMRRCWLGFAPGMKTFGAW